MSNIGWVELLIIVAAVAVLFLVPKKLPQLARSLGKSIRSFKKGVKEGKDEVEETAEEVKNAVEAEEFKSAVSDIRETTDVKGVLSGEKRSEKTGAGASDSKKGK